MSTPLSSHRPNLGPVAFIHALPWLCNATSSIRTNSTTDLSQRPTHGVVDAFFVCLVHGDVLQSEGVGLDGSELALELIGKLCG